MAGVQQRVVRGQVARDRELRADGGGQLGVGAGGPPGALRGTLCAPPPVITLPSCTLTRYTTLSTTTLGSIAFVPIVKLR